MEELKDQTYFSKELTDGFFEFNSISYLDIDGKLYVNKVGQGGDLTKGKSSYKITRENDDKIILSDIVEILEYDEESQQFVPTGETENYEFDYEKIDYRWVFTSFPHIG